MNTIGSVLKTIRLRRNLTQEELSEKSGISFSYISLLERDKRNFNMTKFLTILDALDFSPILIFYLMDTQGVSRELGEKLAYEVFKEFDSELLDSPIIIKGVHLS